MTCLKTFVATCYYLELPICLIKIIQNHGYTDVTRSFRRHFSKIRLVEVLVYITRKENCHFVGEALGVATRLLPANL